jgi:hypothetical protein
VVIGRINLANSLNSISHNWKFIFITEGLELALIIKNPNQQLKFFKFSDRRDSLKFDEFFLKVVELKNS